MPYEVMDMTEARILLLYVFSQLSFPVGIDLLHSLLQGHSWINYFEIRQYVVALAEAELLENLDFEGVEQYALTKRGEEALAMFIGNIPQPILDTLGADIDAHREDMRRESQLPVAIERLSGDEYRVECAVLENGRRIITVTIIAGTHEQAALIASRWRAQALNVYRMLAVSE